jgi:hypothetical protein
LAGLDYRLNLDRDLGCYEAAGGALDQQSNGEAMRYRSQWVSSGVLVPLGLLIGGTDDALAADVGPPAPVLEAPVVPGWTYRVTPYGWLTALTGTQTVRGRSAKVDASFIDIVEKSDSLVALMGNVEARNGPFALYGDLVWSKIGADGGNVRTRTLAPGVTGTLGTSLNLDIEMAIIEVGAAYEVARSESLAFDILGGARYWHKEADLSFDIAGAVDIGNLQIGGARAFARSGSVDWLDPVIGARIRYAMAPGHELFLRGDIGGFVRRRERFLLAGHWCLRLRVRHLPGHHILGRDRLSGALCRLCPRREPSSLRVRHDPARADPRHQRSVLISHTRFQKPAGKG